MLNLLFFLFVISLSYLIGSICSAVIVCKLCSLPDPRTEGSQNPGATNVLRLAGKKYAVIVLLADMLKGFLPLLLGKMFGVGPAVLGFMCLAAVLGHIYPIFFEFKGGKGVATALGSILGLNFLLGFIACLIWFLVAKISRYSSLASIVAVSSTPILILFYPGGRGAFFPLLLMAGLILYQHRENIIRLKNKTESKITL
ncbi:MAG: glycerol-3-phosphate 1-O-acyltransferase PlsY [Legionellaceae bacterium]|nr:glycerol-3-phosphate 1-O-acyltransferase PlsY [Legionellaceae bacterium]